MDKTKIALDRIVRAAEKNDYRILMSHSGGKDSTVIFDLCKKVLDDFTIIHNVKPLLGTSGDPVAELTEMHPETLEFMYTHVMTERPVIFMRADKMRKFLLRAELCSIDGSRACEYNRAGKSSEFIRNGEKVSRSELTEYIDKGLFDLAQCFPIYDWSDDDVFDYIMENDLPLSTEYLKNGELATYLAKNRQP